MTTPVSPPISPRSQESEDQFQNMDAILTELEKNITQETLKNAFRAFENFHKWFNLHSNPSENFLRTLLNFFDRILFCSELDKIDDSLHEIINQKGDAHLRELIPKLHHLPHNERAERKIRYLLWIAKTKDKNKESFDRVFSYYVHIFILSHQRFNEECRTSFFKVYEDFLDKAFPQFEKKLRGSIQKDLSTFQTTCGILGDFEKWDISSKTLIDYLEVANTTIVTLPSEDKNKAIAISNCFVSKINNARSPSPKPGRLTPLETHLEKLQKYRQTFQEIFEQGYATFFNASFPFIFDETAGLQNLLFNHFKTFYEETLTQNSPFSFALPFPPPHEIRLTGSIGRKEPTLYSDLELFIVIKENSWINSFLDHLNQELKKEENTPTLLHFFKGKPLSLPSLDFQMRENLSEEKDLALTALNARLKESPPKEFLKLIKEKTQKYLDHQGENHLEPFKKDLEETFHLLRYFFNIPRQKTLSSLIDALQDKKLFTKETGEFLKELFQRETLEGKDHPYFNHFLSSLELTCNAFGEGPPPQALGLEEQDISRKGLYLDVPEEGKHFLCRSPQEYAHLQKRQGAYDLENGVPFEYSLLQSRLLNSASLDYQDTLKNTLNEPLPAAETRPGMKTFRQKIALNLLAFRLKTFPKSPPLTLIDLKKDLMAPLYYLLSDLALYFEIEETHTLTLIDLLAEKNIFNRDSQLLLKETVSALYMIRSRYQIQTGKEKPIAQETLTSLEKDYLSFTFFLVLKPLYWKVQKVLLLYNKNHENPFEDWTQINLLQESLHFLKKQDSSPDNHHLIKALSTYLLKTKAPLEKHLSFYQHLSSSTFYEPLRKTYLDPLKNSPPYQTLSLYPNTDGFRYSTLDKHHHLIEGLLNMTTLKEEEGSPVKIHSFFFETPRFLKSFIHSQIMNGKTLEHTYSNSRHHVAQGSLDPYHIHFKEIPSHPLMEYAIHTLHERVFGRGTPSIELLRFEVDQEIYPVLATTTLGNTSLTQTLQQNSPLDPISFTEQILLALLTKPGDGRASNYVVDPKGALFCIDNDISFVEPTIWKHFLRKTQFSSVLFCLDGLSLHRPTLETFYSLAPDLILYHWALELENKEQTFLSLFPEVELREKLYNKDPENRFHAELLLKQGTLIALYLQWIHLQTFLRKALKENKIPSPEDLLKQLITTRPENLADKNLIGERVFKAYTTQKDFPPLQRLEVITQEKESRPTDKAQEAYLGRTPTFNEIQERQEFRIHEAKEEIFAIQLSTFREEISLIQEGKIIHADLRHVSKERADLILKGMRILRTYQNPPERVTLVGTQALTGETLISFLGKELTSLNISSSSQITTKDLLLIATTSPHLKELYLSGCTAIKKFAEIGWITDTPLKFPELEELHLEECDLQTLQIEAPHLKILKGKGNPSLITLEMRTPFTINLTLEKEYTFPEGIKPFGPQEWETYFGKVEPFVYPNLPLLIDTLNRPCPFSKTGEKIKETHLLVFIPEKVNGKPFHLDYLSELIQSPKSGHKTEYRYYGSDVKKELGTKNLGSHWVLMTKDVIPGSRNKTYDDQKALVQKHAKESSIPYELPKVLEAATVILMHHVETGQRIYSNSPWTYTRCQEKVNNNQWPQAIGGFAAGGLGFDDFHMDSYEGNGCGGVWKVPH